ncbi:MAG TPA: 3-oxoacyl-ACP synthase [Elusimicrobia bacterium]|nr:3-oxoacyl-ACP synthase [Elusimicrobiota bacterium]HBT62867.1 3-oxoacyl-ACP synthase [Elusimicrobiota bacterium]
MSQPMKVGIIGLGKYLPEKVLTNQDLEKMVETTDDWITERCGIKQRRIARADEATSDMALAAARAALADAQVSPQDIDLIVVATITPDSFFPSTACLLQGKLGCRAIPAFDMAAACSGFVYALSVAEKFIRAGAARKALVVAAEKLSSITDWNDRATCVLFGDGAGAAVLAPVASGGILSTYLGTDGTQSQLVSMPAGGSRIPATHESVDQRLHCIKMNGTELFKVAVKTMADAALEAMNALGVRSADDVSLVIPHQANIRIIKAVAKRMGVALTEGKVYLNIERYGNMSAASTAVALAEAVEEGRIKKGDKFVLVAFGGGLTWGAMVIERS